MTIVLRGPINEPNSHGGTLRNLAVALYKAGVRVRTLDAPSGLWNGYALKERKDVVAILNEVAQTPVKPFEYTLIQHVVPNQFIYDPRARRNIGYATFETDGLPQEWLVPMQAMDQVWCASWQNMHAFRAAGCRRELVYVPHGIDPTIYSPSGSDVSVGLPFGMTRFGCCFDWTPRKNGLSIVEAFFEAFRGREDVVLLMKVYFKGGNTDSLKKAITQIRQNMRIEVGKPRVMLLPDIMPEWEMGDFYRSLNCFVSLSHGEGFCKPVLEAMACGIPCIVPGWGGQMDFCNASNSMFIADSPLGPVGEDQIRQCGTIYAGQNWCYPNLMDVVENMRWFAANSGTETGAAMGRLALETAQRYTWQSIAEHIKELVYGSGN